MAEQLSTNRRNELVRLALGLPEPGMTRGGAPAAAARTELHLDSFSASEDLRLREVQGQRRDQQQERQQEDRSQEQSREDQQQEGPGKGPRLGGL